MEEGTKEINFHDLFMLTKEKGASDLHINVGVPPVLRIDGDLVQLKEYPILMPDMTRELIYGILTETQLEVFEKTHELDFSLSVPGVARFRANILMQRDTLAAVFRIIPVDIKAIEDLGLPPVIKTLSMKHRGLVLVTGITGSGKSTTLAAMIDYINRNRAVHIITVEDPIEFIHRHKKSIIKQREVKSDTMSFTNALKYVLRQDPDVILIGEMRDIETISAAITAAETGHLVFGTLHTTNASMTVDRIIDVFPPHQQEQVRVQLSTVLSGIVSQRLIPLASGTGRVVAVEILINTAAVSNLIKEGKTASILSSIQTGAKFGMKTMDQSLLELYRNGLIKREDVLNAAHDPLEIEKQLGASSSFSF